MIRVVRTHYPGRPPRAPPPPPPNPPRATAPIPTSPGALLVRKAHYMTGGIRAVSDMPGDAIIPWSLGKRCALEFARNGGRFTGVDWEEL